MNLPVVLNANVIECGAAGFLTTNALAAFSTTNRTCRLSRANRQF